MVYSDTMKPLGDKVLLKKLVCTLDKRYGNIVLPQSFAKNASFGVAQVISMGPDTKESGLEINDYVLYDYYSVYHNNNDIVLTKIENVILKITKEEADNYINNYVIK